jgi:hypothetical protein
MDHCTTYGPTINSTKIDRIAICQIKDDVHTIPNFYVEIRPPPRDSGVVGISNGNDPASDWFGNNHIRSSDSLDMWVIFSLALPEQW